MSHSSVRSTTANSGKTLLALVAILSLLLSLFAIARPVIANHEPPTGPEVDAAAEEFPGGGPSCPEGSIGIRFGDSAEDDGPLTEGSQVTVTFPDTSQATVTILSLDDNELTFEVDGGLASIVKVKGGVSSPGTDDQNVYDYRAFTGGGIAHDDGLITPNQQGISHVDFCLVPIEGSIIVYKTDQTQADVAGAEFTVYDGDTVVGGPTDTDAGGLVCFEGLVVGKTYTVVETDAPDGWLPADPDTQTVEALQGSCEDRAGDEPDVTFTNTLLGSLLVLKVDDGDPASALAGAEFTITGPDEFEDAATSDANGWFCLDGLVYGEEYTVTETKAPDGYEIGGTNPQTHTIDDSATCEERLAAEGGPTADLVFVNTEEETGSITVVKEVECEECETRTIGYYFNTADRHEEETNALFAELGGIWADGILFTNVDQVQQYRADDQDGTSDGQNGLSARGQLTLQYLGAVLNVARNGEDCELANRIYNNADSPFDGWTVGDILAEADAAFDGSSEYSDEDIKSALDDINNSSHSDENPLTCEGSESGTLDGVTFDLYLEADYNAEPQGDPIASGETGEDGPGTLTFDGLALDETYVLVEAGFPEGVTCEIVDVVGEGFEFTLNEDGSVTIELTANAAEVTLTVVNECEEDEEEELGSLLIAKEDDAGESLGGATFEVDGTAFTDEDEDGFVCVEGLTLGDTVSVEETVAPDGYIGEEGAVDVVILSTDDCADRLAGDPQADADITFVNVPEDEEEGELEVIKIFCPTEGEDQIFVFGPLSEEPIEFGVQGLDEEEELPSDEGCTLGAPDEEALGATFTITGGDLEEPLVVITTWDEILTLELAPGEYTIVEEGTGLTADFTIAVDQDTAVVVFNYEEEGEEEGRLKILKFYCVGEGDPVFTVVEDDATIGDVTVPDNCESPEPGDATFTLTIGESTSGEFTLGADGARLIPLTVGAYTLNEVDPNEASSAEFDVSADETTTVIVFNFAAEDELSGGGGPGGNEGTAGGNPIPDTALSPTPTGSVPAAFLALLMLAGLGAAGYAVRTEAQRRR